MNAPWTCDNCGQPITKIEDGYVEWLSTRTDGKTIGRGLRLVHHSLASPKRPHADCYYSNGELGTNCNNHLKYFLGPQGLMDLLSLSEELPKEEVVEMIKRLHIPGYEQARAHFDEAIAEGVFEPNTRPSYYNIIDIEAVLKWLKAKDRS